MPCGGFLLFALQAAYGCAFPAGLTFLLALPAAFVLSCLAKAKAPQGIPHTQAARRAKHPRPLLYDIQHENQTNHTTSKTRNKPKVNPILLGVNVDHVATIRQARGSNYPDPVHAALQAEMAGADGITMHLREDRRHIQDDDVERYAACAQTKLNFEMAATDEMINLALRIKPVDVCIVPEKREELTTEGGLNVVGAENTLTTACKEFEKQNIRVSLFIDPDNDQIDATKRTGATVIELHTGSYAEASTLEQRQLELDKIIAAAAYADKQGLIVNAGHGLTRHNVAAIAAIPQIHELNIGHSLIADALFEGLPQAVRTIKSIMQQARANS